MTSTSATLSADDSKLHLTIGFVLACWFIVITVLSLSNTFAPQPGQPPLNILLSALISIGLFFMAYYAIPRFKHYVLNLDMRLLILLHSWRMLGLGFVMLYSIDKLPALFALAAGFGDAIAAIGAVILVYAMFKRPTGVTRQWIWRWNTFGLLDFIIAVSLGLLSRSDSFLTQSTDTSTDLMTLFPFAIIPGFLVQVLTLTHIIIYLQLRHRDASTLSSDQHND